MINIIKTLLVFTAHDVKNFLNGNYNNGIVFCFVPSNLLFIGRNPTKT